MSAADAIVIGGGLIGAFTALMLARRGARVTVLEKGLTGAQSSGANFGSLRLQGRDPAQYGLSLRAQAMWEEFAALTGEDCEYDRTGHLYFARTEAELDKLRRYAEVSRTSGLAVEELTPAETAARFPWLEAPILGASWSARDATANPRLAALMAMRAAQAAGATVMEHCEVRAASAEADGFTVETAKGTFRARWLVNAAGAWGGAVADWFGEPVPIIPAGPPQLVSDPLPWFIGPVVQSISGDVILRQIPRGNVIFTGYPRTLSDMERERTLVPPEKTLAGVRAILGAVPRLRDAHLIRVWSGVEGYMPDMRPVLGPSARQPGLLHGFGCCGHGFQIAPGVGAVLAELILDGETATDISAYGIGRFAGGVAMDEKLVREFDPAAARRAQEERQ